MPNEIAVVKKLVQDMGYTNVQVEPGLSTDWLHVEASVDRPQDCSCGRESYRSRCGACHVATSSRFVKKRVLEVTGRTGKGGQENGYITVYIGISKE